jgi:hypothetical protein
MRVNQRVSEASALRRFFQEQWDYLQELLEDYRSEQAQEAQEARILAEAVEAIVNGTDRRLRALSGYRKRLRESAHELLDHVEEIVAALPEPLLITRKSLVMDGTVRRLVRNREQYAELFQGNALIREFFNDPLRQTCQQAFALLYLIRYDKTVLGTEMRGQLLLRGVRQTAVNFASREVVAPCESEDSVRKVLKKSLFDSVVLHIKMELLQMREARTEEQRRQAHLHPDENLKNPEVYLRLLAEQLRSHRELLTLKDDQIRISKMGIRLPLDSTASSDMLRLFEVGVGGQSRVVTIVCYPRAEFAAAG